MRFLIIPLINLLVLLRVLLGLPFRLLGARSRPAYVRFRLAGDPPYRERSRRARLPLGLGGQSRPEPATVTSLEGFRKALELLAKDAKVKGILLVLEDLEVPPAKREVLVKLLGDFRAAGKRVVAWAVGVDNLGYQVMCAADEVLLSPAGRLDMVGFAAEATAIGEGLGRLGIKAHFFRRGAYKTAPEALHARARVGHPAPNARVLPGRAVRGPGGERGPGAAAHAGGGEGVDRLGPLQRQARGGGRPHRRDV
ncbi:S49 family peptidase [Archangium gephyra]|uniref:S49 family peptidase n=1 Tax=Archangium gephyra TaxID=48 RepID=UPI003B813BBA